jgi:hypothetical protein
VVPLYLEANLSLFTSALLPLPLPLSPSVCGLGQQVLPCLLILFALPYLRYGSVRFGHRNHLCHGRSCLSSAHSWSPWESSTKHLPTSRRQTRSDLDTESGTETETETETETHVYPGSLLVLCRHIDHRFLFRYLPSAICQLSLSLSLSLSLTLFLLLFLSQSALSSCSLCSLEFSVRSC